jgi:hypothetical protein
VPQFPLPQKSRLVNPLSEIIFMTPISADLLTKDDEKRLRDLASGLVRGIEEPENVLARCGFNSGDYTELSETRMFRQMLREAQEEWEGARNTHKRIKLKAAVNVEEALPHFYRAMTSEKEPLSAKVKALEVVARIGGLGQTEAAPAGNGQFFKLEINLGAGVAPMVLANGVENVTIEHEAVGLTQSKVFDALPLEDL